MIPPALRRIPPNGAAAAIGSVATLAVCQSLPAGLPGGVLVEGVIRGTRHALLAVGLVLIFRASRIVNFAQAAMGAIAATVTFQLGAVGIDGVGVMPPPLAFVVGVMVGTGVAVVTELVFVRRFFSSPRLVLTVVTIVLVPTLAGLGPWFESLPFWTRSTEVVRLRSSPDFPGFFDQVSFRIPPYTFGVPEILTVVAGTASLAAIALFLARTRHGAAVRAAAENPDRALQLGVDVRLLSTLVWSAAGFLSALAATSAASDVGAQASVVESRLLLPALAAMVLGRLDNLAVTVVAALNLAVLEQGVAWSFPESRVFDPLLFVVVLCALLIQRHRYSRTAESVVTTWKATEELRTTPRALLELPAVRRTRAILFAVLAVIVVVFPHAASTAQANLASLIAVFVVIALSLVVLTGWGGQVSVGQLALVAVGALVAGKLTGDLGVPFPVAVVLAAAAAAAFAAVVGAPSLRVRGPFLAVATLAFAAAAQAAMGTGFVERLRSDTIERPALLFVSFTGERSYYYLCVTAAVLAAVVVRRLRAGRVGRVLIAIREDEFGVQAFGINAARSRLAVFVLSGALAGLAGALLVHHQRSFDPAAFGLEAGVDMFVMAMIGGVTSVSGAVLGAAYVGLTTYLIADPQVQRLATGGGLLLLLMVAPGGLAQIAYATRDAVLRVVALRNRVAVPSLFSDLDFEAILDGQTVLAPPSRSAGDPLRGRTYVRTSDLYPDAVAVARTAEAGIR